MKKTVYVIWNTKEDRPVMNGGQIYVFDNVRPKELIVYEKGIRVDQEIKKMTLSDEDSTLIHHNCGRRLDDCSCKEGKFPPIPEKLEYSSGITDVIDSYNDLRDCVEHLYKHIPKNND